MFGLNRFKDRIQAGQLLAQRLQQYARRNDAIVLALPRGGVPVGYEIARALELPLDIILVRKLGMPGHEEFAMGAIASGGARFVQDDVLQAYAVPAKLVEQVVQEESAELERREKLYRGTRPMPALRGRLVILVDDGMATGSTMKAALLAVRKEQPARVIVAAPVGSPQSLEKLRQDADEIICLRTPEPFYAVGTWYEYFGQTSDEEVIRLLNAASPVATAVAALRHPDSEVSTHVDHR